MGLVSNPDPARLVCERAGGLAVQLAGDKLSGDGEDTSVLPTTTRIYLGSCLNGLEFHACATAAMVVRWHKHGGVVANTVLRWPVGRVRVQEAMAELTMIGRA